MCDSAWYVGIIKGERELASDPSYQDLGIVKANENEAGQCIRTSPDFWPSA